MGDTTYNHVYGNGTTGDITRAMKASQEGRWQCLIFHGSMGFLRRSGH